MELEKEPMGFPPDGGSEIFNNLTTNDMVNNWFFVMTTVDEMTIKMYKISYNYDVSNGLIENTHTQTINQGFN